MDLESLLKLAIPKDRVDHRVEKALRDPFPFSRLDIKGNLMGIKHGTETERNYDIRVQSFGTGSLIRCYVNGNETSVRNGIRVQYYINYSVILLIFISINVVTGVTEVEYTITNPNKKLVKSGDIRYATTI